MGWENIAGLVLAAGLSRRFGADKLLHPLEGKPLAVHIADTLASLSLGHYLAVCPADCPERAEIFARRGFEVVTNPAPALGLGASLALGAARAGELGAEALLVCLADMPFISAGHLRRLLDHAKDVVATESGGVVSPPALFRASRFKALTALTGDHGARNLLTAAARVIAPPEITRDIDVPADLNPAR